MITAPVIHELGSPPPREDRTGRVPFILELRERPGRLAGPRARVGPLVQPLPSSPPRKSSGSAI
jgi:hypothetical protein